MCVCVCVVAAAAVVVVIVVVVLHCAKSTPDWFLAWSASGFVCYSGFCSDNTALIFCSDNNNSLRAV